MADYNRVKYWIDLSLYDFDTAKAMLDTKRYLYVGFMCHQAIEKSLKACFVSANEANPPYTHNLTVLAEKSGIYDDLSDKQKDFIDFLDPLNIEARYPVLKEKLLLILTDKKCMEIISATEELLKWIIKKF